MLPVLVVFLWRSILIDAILIEDFEKVRIDAIIAIVYKRQGFSRKCRSCGSNVVRGFDDIAEIKSFLRVVLALEKMDAQKRRAWWFVT